VLSKEDAQKWADYSNKKYGALLYSAVKEGTAPPRPDLMKTFEADLNAELCP
jgi:hypothetical protein